jgi:hypothetical protein
MMAWPQKGLESENDTDRLDNKEIKDSNTLVCSESNIMSCVVAEIDRVEQGLVRVTMADHRQVFIPYATDDNEDRLPQITVQRNDLKLEENNTVCIMNLVVKPGQNGNYIDLSATFDTESHGQVELRSDKHGVVMTLPFYHTVFLDERIDTSELKKGKYNLILRIGSNTWEKQLSI